jgi:hypothetical protein
MSFNLRRKQRLHKDQKVIAHEFMPWKGFQNLVELIWIPLLLFPLTESARRMLDTPQALNFARTFEPVDGFIGKTIRVHHV